MTAAPDAKDIHDDIVELRLATAFDNLRVANECSMWGNTTNLPHAVSSLALDGWQATIENVGLSNKWD